MCASRLVLAGLAYLMSSAGGGPGPWTLDLLPVCWAARVWWWLQQRRHRHVHVTKCTELPSCDWMIDHWWRRASECSTSCWWFYLHMRPYLYPFLSHVLPSYSHWTLMGFTCSSLPLAFKRDTQTRWQLNNDPLNSREMKETSAWLLDLDLVAHFPPNELLCPGINH